MTTRDKGITSPLFTAAGSGSVIRTMQAKLQELSISVDDKGAVGNGITDDYPAIILAQNALVALGGGELLFTPGKTYNVNTSIPMAMGVTYKGTGRSVIDLSGTVAGARIVSSNTSIFINNVALREGIFFKDLWLESLAGGGHIFDWSLAGIVAKVEMSGVVLVQRNADKSIVNGIAAGGVFSIWMHDFDYLYQVGNTVPALKFVSTTVNSIVIERFWSLCSTSATSGTYSIWIESTNAVGPALNCEIYQGIFEQPGGGAVNLLSTRNSGIDQCGIYDLVATPNNAMFRIAKGSIGGAPAICWAKGIRSVTGTAGKPDLQIDTSNAAASGHLVESCTLTWLDGVSTTFGPCIAISTSTIANFENIAYTSQSASPTLDLVFGNTLGSSKSYQIWNGYVGNNEGYLNIYQNGTYVGAVGPNKDFRWGGTLGAPANTMTAAGYTTAAPVTVGGLTAAATAGAGARHFVSDANATTFQSIVAGGGANKIPVYSDGVNWRIG
jgi:hypothetical protein